MMAIWKDHDYVVNQILLVGWHRRTVLIHLWCIYGGSGSQWTRSHFTIRNLFQVTYNVVVAVSVLYVVFVGERLFRGFGEHSPSTGTSRIQMEREGLPVRQRNEQRECAIRMYANEIWSWIWIPPFSVNAFQTGSVPENTHDKSLARVEWTIPINDLIRIFSIIPLIWFLVEVGGAS